MESHPRAGDFLDVVSVFRYNGGNEEGGYSMEYFAVIGLLFAPVVCLLYRMVFRPLEE